VIAPVGDAPASKSDRALVDKLARRWHDAAYDKQYDEDMRTKDMSIVHLRFLFEVRIGTSGGAGVGADFSFAHYVGDIARSPKGVWHRCAQRVWCAAPSACAFCAPLLRFSVPPFVCCVCACVHVSGLRPPLLLLGGRGACQEVPANRRQPTAASRKRHAGGVRILQHPVIACALHCGAAVWCCVIVRCGVFLWCGVVWCGGVGVWCGVVCFRGVVWCGVVWCAVAFGVVWCGALLRLVASALCASHVGTRARSLMLLADGCRSARERVRATHVCVVALRRLCLPC
jgi:hypothetical protein